MACKSTRLQIRGYVEGLFGAGIAGVDRGAEKLLLMRGGYGRDVKRLLSVRSYEVANNL